MTEQQREIAETLFSRNQAREVKIKRCLEGKVRPARGGHQEYVSLEDATHGAERE